jgi:hypothetical protein
MRNIVLNRAGNDFPAALQDAMRLHRAGHCGMSAEVESFIETLVNCYYDSIDDRDAMMDAIWGDTPDGG